MVELGQGLPRVMQIRVGHGRVFAHDVHAVQPVVENGVHDLDHGQTRLRVQGDAPQGLEALPYLLVIDPLVVGEHHGNQAGVRRPLDIVLAAQGMESGPGTTDLSGHQRERNETARVVRAVDMLRNAHPPEDHGTRRGGIAPGNLPDGLGGNPADGLHLFGAEAGHVLLDKLKPGGALLDKLPVYEALLDDGVHHGIEQGHVGIGFELEIIRRMAGELGPTGVHDHQRLAGFGRILHKGRRHRMVLRGVGADDDNALRLRHVCHLIGHRARADAFQQGGDRRGVAQPCAVIDVVRPESGPHQLLEKIGFFIAALGRAKSGQGLTAFFVTDFFEAAGRHVERFFPGGCTKDIRGISRVDGNFGGLGHSRFSD